MRDDQLSKLLRDRHVRPDGLARLARWCDLDQHVTPTTPQGRELLARRVCARLGLPLDVPADGRPHYLGEVAA